MSSTGGFSFVDCECVTTRDCVCLERAIECLKGHIQLARGQENYNSQLICDFLTELLCITQNMKIITCENQRQGENHEKRLQEIEERLGIVVED